MGSSFPLRLNAFGWITDKWWLFVIISVFSDVNLLKAPSPMDFNVVYDMLKNSNLVNEGKTLWKGNKIIFWFSIKSIVSSHLSPSRCSRGFSSKCNVCRLTAYCNASGIVFNIFWVKFRVCNSRGVLKSVFGSSVNSKLLKSKN